MIITTHATKSTLLTRIAFPDDVRAGVEVCRVHHVHDLGNLRGVQVFQKRVCAQRVFDQVLGPNKINAQELFHVVRENPCP